MTKHKRYQLIAQTENGYHETLRLIICLWYLKVIDQYQCFFDADAKTNTIYYWVSYDV